MIIKLKWHNENWDFPILGVERLNEGIGWRFTSEACVHVQEFHHPYNGKRS